MKQYKLNPKGSRCEFIDSSGAQRWLEVTGESGGFELDGQPYELTREQGWGDFLLLGADASGQQTVLARATKQGPISRSFDVQLGTEPLRLTPVSSVRDSFELNQADRTLLRFQECGFFKSRYEITELADTEPSTLMFVAWLVVLMWRRSQAALTPPII